MADDRDYDALAAKLAEVKASSQGWIDAVRRKRAEARILEVTEDRDDALTPTAAELMARIQTGEKE